MSLFGTRLRTAWEFPVRGVIWRVHHAVGDIMIGEERDLDKKRTSFFSVHRTTGKVLWKNVSVQEPWWVGIALVERDVLLLHGYATPDMPNQRGLTAIDIEKGTVLWSNNHWALEFATEKGLVVVSTARDQQGKFEVDRRSATILGTIHPDDPSWPQERRPAASGTTPALLPVPFDTTHLETAGALHTYGARYLQEGKSGITEYLTLPRHLILTTYEYPVSGPTGMLHTRVMLRILDAAGKEQFADVLAAHASGQIPDAFFLQEGMMYYVRERRVLCAVKIS